VLKIPVLPSSLFLMVDDGNGVALRDNEPTNPVSRRPESGLDTDSKKTDGLTNARKIIAFKVSHLVVSLIVAWFW
jgi:hypothetical protein